MSAITCRSGSLCRRRLKLTLGRISGHSLKHGGYQFALITGSVSRLLPGLPPVDPLGSALTELKHYSFFVFSANKLQ